MTTRRDGTRREDPSRRDRRRATAAIRTARIAATRRAASGSLLAAAAVAALAGAMLPVRGHLSVATTALVLVVPVVIGVARGGFAAGVSATLCGFVVYDLVFIPPYYTLTVGAAQNWVALGVYAVVMVVVARVVSQADRARAVAQHRASELRRLFDLSELLVREAPPGQLLDTIVSSVVQAFDLDGAALLLPGEDRLRLAASAGEDLDAEELEELVSHAGGLASGRSGVSGGRQLDRPGRRRIETVALSASGQPIGILALRGAPRVGRSQELLRAFANHLALALERGQLREQALRAQLLEESDRLRRSLVGAVSHDLRTPLATIKVSTSTLLDPAATLDPASARELLGLVDAQADRLDRLVANLLDMTRIQSGTLVLRRSAVSVAQLVDEAEAVLGSSADHGRLRRDLDAGLPLVDADPILVRQVLANLVDNALRYSPESSPVTVSARPGSHGKVVVTVADEGTGVAAPAGSALFQADNRREAGGRGGLGLAIAQAFVEAHGERIWLERNSDPGARFSFSLPVSHAAPAVQHPPGRAPLGGPQTEPPVRAGR